MSQTGQQTARKFLTLEQRETMAKGSFAPYWWLDDSLCRRFLVSCASDPATFETRKLLFPFFRDGALYGPQRGLWAAPTWMTMAFFAGWHFGRRHPDAALATVEAADEIGASLHRLDRIRRALGKAPPQPRPVLRVMQHMAAQWEPMEPAATEALLVDQCVKLLHAGAVAATRAHLDTALSDLAGQIRLDETNPIDLLHLRAWVRSVADSYRRPVLDQMRHPLFRVGAEYYVDRPIQWSVMEATLESVLVDCRLQSEANCPRDHDQLIALVEAGVEAGRRLQRSRPGDLKAIREEAGLSEWNYACQVVSEVAEQAGSTQPSPLEKAVCSWHQRTCGPGDGTYGWELTRAVRAFDFAVWVGWLIPTVRRKGDNPMC